MPIGAAAYDHTGSGGSGHVPPTDFEFALLESGGSRGPGPDARFPTINCPPGPHSIASVWNGNGPPWCRSRAKASGFPGSASPTRCSSPRRTRGTCTPSRPRRVAISGRGYRPARPDGTAGGGQRRPHLRHQRQGHLLSRPRHRTPGLAGLLDDFPTSPIAADDDIVMVGQGDGKVSAFAALNSCARTRS